MVLDALSTPEFSHAEWRIAPEVTPRDLGLVHTSQYIESIRRLIPVHGLWNVDPDTVLSPGSWNAALHAAGAVCAAVDAVLEGPEKAAFCAVRPPGHHASAARAAGFCVFNNIAIGAMHSRHVQRLKRVAVVDFDLHHGNGTQAIFWDDPGLFYGSTHQWPYDPGTGAENERGLHGNVVNVPLSSGDTGVEFRTAVTTKLLPPLRSFAPELLLVSAGFDGHEDDPLGHLNLKEADFEWIARVLMNVAYQCCGGRLVAVLEGGYNLAAIGPSVAAFVRGMSSWVKEREG